LGEETGLLEVIENRSPLPRVARPYLAFLAEGADWLRQWGTEASPGTMCLTVAGDTGREGVWELPISISVVPSS
jgi:NADH-quinone oxidoreductase subunit F